MKTMIYTTSLLSSYFLEFWGITLKASVIIHIIFEIVENTTFGISMINKFYYWPGGKTHADSVTNSIGDTVFFISGWVIAKILEDP